MYVLQCATHTFTFCAHEQLGFFLLTCRRILQEDTKCSLSQIILVQSAILSIISKPEPHLRARVVVLQVL